MASSDLGITGYSSLSRGSSVDEDPGNRAQPIMLFCKACRLLLSDTTGFVGSLPGRITGKTGFLCVTGAYESVQMNVDRIITSTTGFDSGCSYVLLECKCGSEVGRSYRATVSAIDVYRDKYLFDASAISLQPLGVYRASNVDVSFSDMVAVNRQEFDQLQEKVVSLEKELQHTQDNVTVISEMLASLLENQVEDERMVVATGHSLLGPI